MAFPGLMRESRPISALQIRPALGRDSRKPFTLVLDPLEGGRTKAEVHFSPCTTSRFLCFDAWARRSQACKAADVTNRAAPLTASASPRRPRRPPRRRSGLVMADEADTPLLGAAADELGVGNVLLNVLPVTTFGYLISVFSVTLALWSEQWGSISALGGAAFRFDSLNRRRRRHGLLRGKGRQRSRKLARVDRQISGSCGSVVPRFPQCVLYYPADALKASIETSLFTTWAGYALMVARIGRRVRRRRYLHFGRGSRIEEAHARRRRVSFYRCGIRSGRPLLGGLALATGAGSG